MLCILTKRSRRSAIPLRHVALLGCILTATLSISSGLSYAQASSPKRSAVVDTKTLPPPQQSGRYFALIVGIDEYQYLPHLRTARNDAQKLATVLSDQYGFKTQLLLNASRDQIIGALDQYRHSLDESDSLLIYYAGHGYFDEAAGLAYWAPTDAGQDTYARWVEATVITGTAKAIPARHVLVISDSCYSGMLTRDATLSRPTDRANYVQRMAGTRSRNVMSSGGNEPVADSDTPGHDPSHSVFANVLLQDLRQFQSDEFTAEQLFVQIKEEVGGRSKQLPQYNPIRDSSHEGGDFVFVRAGHVPEQHPQEVHLAAVVNPEEEAVRAALDTYEDAYSSMDVRDLKKVWPSLSKVQEREIKSGFDAPGLKAVKVQLRNRTTHISRDTATADCDQWMVYTFAGRRQPPQTNSVEILLSKNSGGGWVVNDVKGR
jgi:hypothetical protein